MAWGDYDSDGDQDLYVSNDFGRNTLYRNNNDGTFQDVAHETGTIDFGFGMSATFGDIDNDGDLDIYIANSPLFDAQGNVIGFGENILYQNTLNQSSGLTVRVRGKGNGFSNTSGIGARIKIFPQGSGTPAGHQEIRSGAGPLEVFLD